MNHTVASFCTTKGQSRTDLTIELPEEGHTISNFAFDRGGCMDPLGAEII
jgi:hypothetical protein